MWPHNPQLGAIQPNRKLHPLWLSALDPADDYLRAVAMPEHAYSGRREQNDNPILKGFRWPWQAGRQLPPNVEVVPIVDGELDPTYNADGEDADYSYFGLAYGVFVGGAMLASFEGQREAFANAAAIAEYARARRVETSRLS